jgi:iron(III) transport system ATP-binding protein
VARGGARPAAVALEGIAKKFGVFIALRGVSLSVEPGEFVCFLGPSGCGKTTLLRIIAGLERQNAGAVLMGGRDVSALPAAPAQLRHRLPVLRALSQPHRGPQRGVRTRDAQGGQGGDRAAGGRAPGPGRAAHHREKYPAQLSGGEQQRIALARALAPSPALLLLDEPLSALDARVRQSLRHEIRALQRRLGITTIMVTHDQEEALAMADRIVVMNHGVVEQVGPPAEVYMRPRSPFVARFVGQMNFLDAVAGPRPGVARLGAVELTLPAGRDPGAAAAEPGAPSPWPSGPRRSWWGPPRRRRPIASPRASAASSSSAPSPGWCWCCRATASA